MATLAELQDVMQSVRSYSETQTNLLTEMVKLQSDEISERKRREEREKADRTKPPASSKPTSVPDTSGTAKKPGAADPEAVKTNKGLLGTIFAGTAAGELLAKALTPLGGLFKKMTGIVFSLTKVFKYVLGPSGAIFLLYTLLRDIGENNQFTNALQSLQKLWTDRIIPIFKRLEKVFMNLLGIEGIGSVVELATTGFNNLKNAVQGFVVDTISIFTNVLSDTFDGIEQMLDGDFLGGLTTIFTGLYKGLLNITDSLITRVLNIFGVDFGEDGSFAKFMTRKVADLFYWVSDMFTSAVSKVTDGLAYLGSFFEPLIDGVKDVFALVKDLFTFGESDKTVLGALGKLQDIVYMPVNAAINLVRSIFGFKEDDAEPFKLQDWMNEQFRKLSDLGKLLVDDFIFTFGQLFDTIKDIPANLADSASAMWIDLKEKIKLGFSDLSDWLASIPKKMMAMLTNIIGSINFEVPSWVPKIGGKTISFMDQDDIDRANQAANSPDAASETRRAAIITEAEEERKALALRKLQRLEERALTEATPAPVIVNTPDNRVIQVSQQGGSTSNVINSLGGSSSDLDLGSRPSGVH